MDWVIFLPLLVILHGDNTSAASHASEGFYMECGGHGYIDKYHLEFGHISPTEGCIPEATRCYGKRTADSRRVNDCSEQEPCFVSMASYLYPRCQGIDCVMVTYLCIGEDFEGKILTINYTYPEFREITTTTTTVTTTAIPETAKTSQLVGLSVGISLLALLVIVMLVIFAVMCIKRRKLQRNTKRSLIDTPSPGRVTSSKTLSNELHLELPVPQHTTVTPTAPPAPSSVYVDIGDSHEGVPRVDQNPYTTIDDNIAINGTHDAQVCNGGIALSSQKDDMGVPVYSELQHNRDTKDNEATELHENAAYISAENKE